LAFNVYAREKAVDEFVRYLHIIEKFEICECFYSLDGEFGRKNEKTYQFHKQGGFKALYADLKEKRERDKLEFKLAESNIRANELNEKTAKRNKRDTAINILLGIINIVILIWQGLKTE